MGPSDSKGIRLTCCFATSPVLKQNYFYGAQNQTASVWTGEKNRRCTVPPRRKSFVRGRKHHYLPIYAFCFIWNYDLRCTVRDSEKDGNNSGSSVTLNSRFLTLPKEKLCSFGFWTKTVFQINFHCPNIPEIVGSRGGNPICIVSFSITVNETFQNDCSIAMINTALYPEWLEAFSSGRCVDLETHRWCGLVRGIMRAMAEPLVDAAPETPLPFSSPAALAPMPLVATATAAAELKSMFCTKATASCLSWVMVVRHCVQRLSAPRCSCLGSCNFSSILAARLGCSCTNN